MIGGDEMTTKLIIDLDGATLATATQLANAYLRRRDVHKVLKRENPKWHEFPLIEYDVLGEDGLRYYSVQMRKNKSSYTLQVRRVKKRR